MTSKVLSGSVYSKLMDFNRQKFEGKRIGIIGGGSSAIQIIPALQKVKDTQLTCMIRSKIWIANPFGAEILQELGVKNTDCKSIFTYPVYSNSNTNSHTRTTVSLRK